MWAHEGCQSLPRAQNQACVDLHRGKVCGRRAPGGGRAGGRREVREKSVATAAPPTHTHTENCYPALQEEEKKRILEEYFATQSARVTNILSTAAAHHTLHGCVCCNE